jgi:hypothetical protein
MKKNIKDPIVNSPYFNKFQSTVFDEIECAINRGVRRQLEDELYIPIFNQMDLLIDNEIRRQLNKKLGFQHLLTYI